MIFCDVEEKVWTKRECQSVLFLGRLWWVDTKKSHAKLCTLIRNGNWPFWKCWDLRTFGRGSRVIFTVRNNWWGDLAAFNNTVLSAAAVSKLPWERRDGTISSSRLASNITVHNFLYYKTFLFGHQVFLYPGKNSLFSRNVNVTYIFVCAEVMPLLMKVIMDSGWDSSMTCVWMYENVLV